MSQIRKPSVNRLDILLEGPIDADIMRALLEDLFEKSAGIESGVMLYTIKDFSMPTLGAVGVEMTYLPKMFQLLGRFDKCAVLCDMAWLRVAAEVEGKLFPGIDIKAFEMHEENAAEAWLTSPD